MGVVRSTAAVDRGEPYVVGLEEVTGTQADLVGGKGAQLGELSRVEGLQVPAGFCVTTDAFRRIVSESPPVAELVGQLSRLDVADRDAISRCSAEIRRTIEGIAIPDELASAIGAALERTGPQAAYAVRSSATAEDLPTASFAGQQDTYLNVIGAASIVEHVRRCWASLFTERAVAYRVRAGFDHRRIQMAVVVQRMVFPDAAGVLFTADPVTSNRKVVSIEASFGLGEGLVSGLVNPDTYRVRDGVIVERAIGTKRRAVHAAPAGGTMVVDVEPQAALRPALTDEHVIELARLGRRIEAHAGCPQDIEWCVADDVFSIVQSRPITTLYPIPAAADDEHRVYVSVGHQQMMIDPMKPLGLSLFQLTAGPPMHEAGGRLFVDVTERLASPATRADLMALLGKSDPLIGDALQSVVERGFVEPRVDVPSGAPASAAPVPQDAAPDPIETDPAIPAALIAQNQASIVDLRRVIRALSGPALLDFILGDVQVLKRILFDSRSHEVIMAGMEATWWLNDQLGAWLGETNAADTLTQSVPHNVTSEMGLALLDVADVIRRHPDVVAFLDGVEADGLRSDDALPNAGFVDALAGLDGGEEASAAIRGFLDRYGMRCAGEIDITRPRWSEHPTTLVPAILGNVKHFGPGAGGRRFEQGRLEALAKEHEVLERLGTLPDGERKAAETKRMIERVRTFAGYREYPKYGIVCRYAVYKKALLGEAERLVRRKVIRDRDDIFFLTFAELHDVVRTNRADDELIGRRKEMHRANQALHPPRVLTSEGERVAGSYRRDGLPAGALIGLAVSSGTVEGTARVILDIAEADLEPGDILITTYTDPSWTPLFVVIAGLVTEVGGLMTHGAVIAREYGLPAVVGVEGATRLIRDGQRIRVHGTAGYVEVLG